jgi:hypothetical protein
MREAEDAGMRDVQIRENADLARLDHVLAEPCEIAGARAAGIDRGGDARGAAELLGVDAERGAAPIDMGVQIDQAGRDDGARHVADVRSRIGLELGSDLGDLAVGEGDVRHGVKLLRRVNHPAAAQDQIESHYFLRRCPWKEWWEGGSGRAPRTPKVSKFPAIKPSEECVRPRSRPQRGPRPARSHRAGRRCPPPA